MADNEISELSANKVLFAQGKDGSEADGESNTVDNPLTPFAAVWSD